MEAVGVVAMVMIMAMVREAGTMKCKMTYDELEEYAPPPGRKPQTDDIIC